ncbi:MAG TPA: acyltransferase [Labilithrix sp.]|nr:acyltransferase [Labilithrix sp.]
MQKLGRALGANDRSPTVLVRKVARNATALVRATVVLRELDHVGARARGFGGAHVVNAGVIAAGDDLTFGGRFGVVGLASGAGATLMLGDRVTINYGSFLSAVREVVIDDDVMVGPYCIITDGDGPVATDDARPIYIGPNVWLAARVVVRPGARIGAGAVISAGSVVEGDIPANAVASGCPARVLRIHEGDHGRGDTESGKTRSPVARIRRR